MAAAAGFAEHTSLAHFLQARAHRRHMLGSRLHLGGHAEHPGMLEPVGILEVIEGLMEDKVGLTRHSRQTRLQARIQGIEPGVEGRHIALVAHRVRGRPRSGPGPCARQSPGH